MRRFASSLRRPALAILLLAVGFVGGWLCAKLLPLGGDIVALVGPGMGANSATPAALRDQFSSFWESWNLVENEFYRQSDLDRKKMIQGAIKGMLGALDDPYTIYQEPQLAALTTEHMQGTQEGIGIYLRIGEGAAFVDRPIKGSPALQAGLQQGDEIVAVDGEQIAALTAGLDVNQANVAVASKIRGPRGSKVTLTIRRGGKSFDVTITRDTIVISSVSAQILPDGIAYIKITDFKTSTTADFDEAWKELQAQSPTRMILDLRNNPGGYLVNAQEVLGRFYDGAALYEQGGDGSLKELPTIGGAKVGALPLVVLVNGGSASASEIVAGALRDERPGTYLLGEKTYGKGSVQNIHTLSDSGSIRVTIAHWLTPAKSAIHKVGITPQFVVPYAEDAADAAPCVADRTPAEGQSTCGDSQLAWAIRLLVDGQQPPAAAAAK